VISSYENTLCLRHGKRSMSEIKGISRRGRRNKGRGEMGFTSYRVLTIIKIISYNFPIINH
jgi:hypothetical protein